MNYEKLKKCTCGEKAGCTDKCTKGMTFWEVAIYEARSLPPTTRENTLDWILNRIEELKLEPKIVW